jgi:hypothetical protein
MPRETSPTLAAALLHLLVSASSVLAEPPASGAAGSAPAPAQFRGCDTAGWCRFSLEADPSLRRVRPDGVVRAEDDAALAIAIRDRLNALLASMIHQHKQIELHRLRALGDGTFAATVTVNGLNVASDPMLRELGYVRPRPAR